MPVNLESLVNKSITELKRKLSRAASELTALNKELKRYENAHKLLFRGGRGVKTTKRKAPKLRVTDWKAVLKKLPDTFTSKAFRKAAGRSSSAVYSRQVLARWAKQHRIKRVAQGKYKKKI